MWVWVVIRWNKIKLSFVYNFCRYFDSNNIVGVLDILVVVGSSFGRILWVLSMKNNNIINVVYINVFIDGV